MEDNIENIRRSAIQETKEKTKVLTVGKYVNFCNKEFQGDMKRLGFDNGNKFIVWMQQNGVLKNPTNIERRYKENVYKDLGYECKAHYDREWSWNNGSHSPHFENENCPHFIGVAIGEVIIAEPILVEIFGGIKRKMPYNNPGFEYIATGNNKIDVKTVKLANYKDKLTSGWGFNIRYNRNTDYFMLIATNEKGDIAMHIWLIHRDETIRERKFWRREKFWISKTRKLLETFKKYEYTDRLNCLKEINDKLKGINK